jgi:RES domain-containing protein
VAKRIHYFTHQDWIKRLKSVESRIGPWTGIAFRNCLPLYATTKDLLTGGGSSLHGGRWNPQGVKAVYASLTPETPMYEALAHFRYYGIPPADAMPRVFVAIRAKLCRVLDLTDPGVRRTLGVSLQGILREDWRKVQRTQARTLSQSIGGAAFGYGIEAILVPSASHPRGKNLVCFPHNFSGRSRLDIHRAEQLTR